MTIPAVKVLFVCLGNICRSPAAEATLKHFIKDQPDLNVSVESRGIGDWYLGQSPDRRMQEASLMRGLTLTGRAQQFQLSDFDRFDYILASDKEVLNTLFHHASTPHHKAKVNLMTHFSFRYRDQEIPDPYYASSGAFDLVLDMLEDACSGLIAHVRAQKV